MANNLLISPKISRDLDANKEHTHHIGNDNGGDPCGGVGNLDTPGPVLIKGKIQEDNPNATKHKHKPRGESFDDVLTVDSAWKEDNRSDGASGRVLG